MFLVLFYLHVEFIHGWYTAVRPPPQPMLQLSRSLILIFKLQKEPKRFFESIGTIQAFIVFEDYFKSDLLLFSQMFGEFTESIGLVFDLVTFFCCLTNFLRDRIIFFRSARIARFSFLS